MTYLFLNLKIRSGEYEFSSLSTWYINSEEPLDIQNSVRDYVDEFYGGPMDREGETRYFDGGALAVTITEVREISQKQYDVLNEFL